MPTVAELGQRVKAKHPGAYDDLPDEDLGRKVKAKFPGAYDDFADAAPVSGTEAVLRGAAQGLTLKFGDELVGNAKALASAPADWLYEKLNPQDPTTSPSYGETYQKGRDENRAANKTAEAAHPWKYGLSEFAGSLPLAVAAPATLPAMVGLGAAAGIGGSEATDAGQLALDAGLGAGGGALGYGAGKALQAVAPRVAGKAGDLAERAAVRSTNADLTATRRAFLGNDAAAAKTGRFMLDEGFPLRSPSGIKDRAQAIQASLGPKFGALTQAAEQAGAKADLAGAVANAKVAPAIAGLQKNTETRAVFDKVAALLDDQLAQHGGQVSPVVAHDLRMQLDGLAKWDALQPTAVKSAWKAARRAVDDKLDEAMQAAGLGNEWSATNASFRQAKILSSERPGVAGKGLADIGAERLKGNRWLSPSEKAAAVVGGATALASGNPAPLLLPVGAYVANRGTFPALARTLDATSRAAASPMATGQGALGNLIPAAGAAAGMAMAPQKSPVPTPKQLASTDPVVGKAYAENGAQGAAATFYSEAQKRPDQLLSWLQSGAVP